MTDQRDKAGEIVTAEQLSERYRGHIRPAIIRNSWGRLRSGVLFGPPRVEARGDKACFRLADVLEWEQRCHVRCRG